MTAAALYMFTGETHVTRSRRDRFGNRRAEDRALPATAVSVLATDQADAERIATAMLSTPEDTPKNGYSTYVDTYTRSFTWKSVVPAPADAATAETLRQELAQRTAELGEAQSAYRLAAQQAEAEREQADAFASAIDRVRALHVKDDDTTACYGCYSTWPGHVEEHPDWPCATIRALEGEAAR